MRLFKQSDLKLYTKCHEISIWRFTQLLKINDFNLLLKKGSRKIKESDKEYLSKIYFDLFNEYVELSGDGNIEMILRKRAKISVLQVKSFVINFIIDMIIRGIDQEYYVELLRKDHKITIDLSKDFQTEVQSAIQWTKAFMQEIEELKHELNEKTDQQEKTIEQQAVTISKYLGFRVNVKKVTVTEWLGLIKDIKENGKRD